MAFDDRGPNRNWPEDGSVCGSSSRSDDMPTNPPSHTNDPRLTGSSAHAPQPQGSGLMSPFDNQNPTLISYNNYQTPRSEGSGPLSPGEWPGGFQADYADTWANTRIPDSQTTTDVTGYYPTQSTSGDAPAGNSHHPATRSSPFYPMPTRVDTMVQPTSYQSYDTQYSSEGRTSHSQDHSPSPSQPTSYPSLLTSPQSDPSYSYPAPNQLQPRQSMPLPADHQWPPSHVPSNRNVSDPTPVTYHHNYADSQSQIYSPVVVSSSNHSQASNPTSLTQPSSLGEAPPYQHCPLYPPTDGPSFSVSQHSQPTRARGKRTARIHPYPESGRKTGKKVSPSSEQPVASSSRVTLDSPPPPTAPRGKHKHLTKAHERDAERKKGYREALKDWFQCVTELLPSLGTDAPSRLQILGEVIKRLGGTVPALVDRPKTTKRKDPKSVQNGIRAHNEDRRYDEVRTLLKAGGYRVDGKTSYVSLLQIVAYVLQMGKGAVDEELAKLITRFLPDP